MKPIKLIMSAFGPYKDKEEVDFTLLGDNGIFLITGDTGAGKTTIFDGICFALFGESSGSNRESISFRSKFSSIDTPTFVELTFIHKGKTYLVNRNPSYVTPKKRGEGTTTKNPDAYLEVNGEVISGIKSVNDKIVEILGINAKQFKQISMLAQGEFLKILFADTEDRKKIFRKIFQTDLLDLITIKLNEKYKSNKDNIEILKTEFITNYSNIIGDDIISLKKEEITKENINDTLSLLDKLICDTEKEKLSIDSKYDKLNDKHKSLESSIKLITDNNKRLEDVKILEKEKDELIKKIDYFNKIRSDISTNNKILRVVKPIEINISTDVKEIDNLNVLISSKNKLIKLLEEDINNINLGEEKLVRLKNILLEYNDVVTKISENNELLKQVNEVIEYFDKKSVLSNEYLIIEKEYSAISERVILEEDKYFKNQAGILASTLKDNSPCPVCGSLSHPVIATITDDVLDKKVIDKLKSEKDVVLEKLNNIKSDINGVNSNISLINKRINCSDLDSVNLLKNNLITENGKISSTIFNLNEEFNSIYKYLTGTVVSIELFNLDEFTDSFNKKNISIKNDLITNKTLVDDYNKKIKVLNENISSNNKLLLSNITELGFNDMDDYKNNVLSDKDIKLLEDSLKEYDSSIITNRTKLESINSLITSKDVIDTSKMVNELEELSSNIKLISESRQAIYNKLDNNKNISKKINITSKKLVDLMDKFSIYEDLYKLSSGNITGKRKVSFEQYVQATYFDMVLNEANKRLINMSDGRFKLVRKDDTLSLNSKFALDLDVFDAYNGSLRDVKSLSGGESFKASLSLALGLSDVIQNYSGGIVIDTLFIDEGFGSLDDESRENAINTLNLISNNNKLIGIISHVSELKDRIDKKIIVSKGKNGSIIDVEV